MRLNILGLVAMAASHGTAFQLLFAYLGAAGVAGAIAGSLLAERYFRRRPGPALTFGRRMAITALAVAGCAIVVFAVLSLFTLLVMQFM